MAVHIGQPTRSRRFIKVYLMTWAVLAVGALAYLAMLAFPPLAATPHAELSPTNSAPDASKALAEVRSMRGSLSDIRKDVTQLQDAVGERVTNEKVVQSRLTVLEERVATIDPPHPAPVTAPNAKVPEKTARRVPDQHTTADILAKAQEAPVPPLAPKASTPPAAPIETGSITSKVEITFGEAVVKLAAQKDFAVQLGAGPSLQALRENWGDLVERHSGSLAALQPRVVAPRAEGGPYRLLAGPVPSKADADRICRELAVGPKACFATAYAGAPL